MPAIYSEPSDSERNVAAGACPRASPRHSAFNERLQPGQCLIPLLRDGIEVFLDFFNWLRIQRGQAFVSQVINAVRNGPFWQDSVIFITYNEHGGYYDHVAPLQARQGNARTPDGISPGQCADLSNPPFSQQPGGGAECAQNPFSTTDTSVKDAELLCPAMTANPAGPYPDECASFNQLGFRVPFMAVSPFSKPHYVSHTIGDHTSLLAFIEKRFLSLDDDNGRLHLTKRDQHADTLEDLFDFERSPSLDTPVGQALPPASDCTPH